MKAIIPAAGLGTRFLPATKAVPKEMLPIIDKPTIQYVVEEAMLAGCDEVLVITSEEKPAIRKHFSTDQKLVDHLRSVGKEGYAQAVEAVGQLPVSFLNQKDALGLADAIATAQQAVLEVPSPEAFFVLLGDVLVPDGKLLGRMKELSSAHQNASVIAVDQVSYEEVVRFGNISGSPVPTNNGSKAWLVHEIIEKPAPSEILSDLVIFGRYLFSPRLMELLATAQPRKPGAEVMLTDLMTDLMAEEELYALLIDKDEGFDVGTVPAWLAANQQLAARLTKG